MLENKTDYEKYKGNIVYVYQIWNESYRQDDCFAIALIDGEEVRFYLGFDEGYHEPLNRYIDASQDKVDAFHTARMLKMNEEKNRIEQKRLLEYCEHCTDFAVIDNNKRLYKLYCSDDRWEYIIKELSHAKRSQFRLSLKKQVIQWLNDDNPRYDSPLSPNQFNAMLQYYKKY